MIQGVVRGWDGTDRALPPCLSWRLAYGPGVPCDSFLLTCPWEPGGETFERGMEVVLTYQGAVCFRGLVDEVEHRISERGGEMELAGRGMAARLLDNEALPAEYQVATTADILRDHVEPYGIQVAEAGDLPPVSGFSISSGESEWSALYQFARYYGGVSPRFDREGRLYLTPFPDREALVVDGTVAVARLCWRERRYGVLSQVLVRDRTTLAVEPVDNAPFQAQGGLRRQVLTMPGKSSYQAMRYSGTFQIDRSRAEQREVELTVPALFFAWPGDLVRLERPGWGCNGLWRVREAVVTAGDAGGETALVLADPDLV